MSNISLPMILCSCYYFAVAASTKKYVLCTMPADWATLPVHTGFQSTPRRDSIAVYTKNWRDRNLVYEGFICPPAPEKLSLSALQLPPRQESFGKKYARLQEKIRAEEAEAEAQKKVISEDERNSVADNAASSKPEEGVVKAELSAMPGREDTADESKQQLKAEAEATSESKNKPEHLNLSLQRTESSGDYPLPLEILDRRESLLPVPLEVGTDTFLYCFEPWEDTVDMELLRYLCAEPDPSEQLGSARPADTCHTPEDGESSPEIYFDLG